MHVYAHMRTCVHIHSILYIHANMPPWGSKVFCSSEVGRACCTSSNLDGGSKPRNCCLLLRFSLYYMLSLHLLYKYKHSREEHKEEEKEYTNMQYKGS